MTSTEQPVQIDTAEEGSGPSSMLFPTFSDRETGDPSSTSPDSNATTHLTSSDKLSALPPSMTSPNLNRGHGARSPMMNMNTHGHSPRMFRHSLDASRSWPSITQSGLLSSNMEGFAGFSPTLSSDADHGFLSGKDTRRPRVSASEGSIDHDHDRRTSRKTSMDSDRTSLPTMQSVRQVLNRLRRGSDPTASSYAVHGEYNIKSDHNRDVGSRSPSHSPSRAASPLRIFQQWSQGIHHRPHTPHHHEEPFIPVDPFQSQFLFTFQSGSLLPMWIRKRLPGYKHDNADAEGLPMQANVHPQRTLAAHHPNEHRSEGNGTAASAPDVHKPDHVHVQTTMDWRMLQIFFLDTLPRLIYLHLLLRIPSMYFSRVARIFEDAEVSKPDIQRMVEACGRGGSHFLPPPPQQQQQTQTNAIPVGQEPANNANNAQAQPSSLYATINSSARGLGPASAASNLAAAAAASVVDLPLPLPEDWKFPLVSPSLIRFKLSWETFIDSLMREWKTLNVVSALLLSCVFCLFLIVHNRATDENAKKHSIYSAILTMFQIDSAETDPLTRTAALLSLICAIMSLSYGCIYIVRFGTMRSMYRASIWAEVCAPIIHTNPLLTHSLTPFPIFSDSHPLQEAQKTKTLLWWNVWVLLAMPAIWMSWSMILFILSILSFVWRTGDSSDPQDRPPLSDAAELGPRVAITFVFLLGMVYFFLIVRTLRGYGSKKVGYGSGYGYGYGGRGEGYVEIRTRKDREGVATATRRPEETRYTPRARTDRRRTNTDPPIPLPLPHRTMTTGSERIPQDSRTAQQTHTDNERTNAGPRSINSLPSSRRPLAVDALADSDIRGRDRDRRPRGQGMNAGSGSGSGSAVVDVEYYSDSREDIKVGRQAQGGESPLRQVFGLGLEGVGAGAGAGAGAGMGVGVGAGIGKRGQVVDLEKGVS
ncbi:hypothetical protein EV360DRAFT_85976 [Lentinula raphanica]|nr:hypothetical protein EV360DRAFT_85976 [Lentinula raphanica]